MERFNIEIKARCADLDRARGVLHAHKARLVGTDHQIDTYFKCAHGRLKLREGNIERALIHYLRENQPAPKHCAYLLYQPNPGDELKEMLTRALGVLAVVDKTREIYYVENVKLHLDEVQGLGAFVEVEAISDERHPDRPSLLAQCRFFMDALGVRDEDLISCSYSDMILESHTAACILK